MECTKTSKENVYVKSGLIFGSCYASLKRAAAKTSMMGGLSSHVLSLSSLSVTFGRHSYASCIQKTLATKR